jgi:pimeloyl-ACP methyl ester carboxylesterase
MAEAWGDLQARVGAFARVCAYDRLGVGGSGDPPEAQTFAGMAATLDGVLSELDLKRPVVLVAHSLGGMLAATWASGHPKEVRGLLLIDATGPGYPMRLMDLLPRRGKSAGAALRNDFEAFLKPSKNVERLDGRVAFAAVETLTPMGDVPMTVLTHSIIDPGDVQPETAAALESFWEEGQNRWLELATQARLERVDRAGHFIQLDQPQLVADRVQELVDD